MLLIASVLLNAPALAGALGAGGGPGEPPVGYPSRGPGGGEGAAGPRFNGSLSSVISFPFTGGSDDALRLALPRECLVLNATLQLDGQPAVPPATDRKCTFSDIQNNRAWFGVSGNCPPSAGPGSFQANQFNGGSYSDISRSDGSYYETMTWDAGSPYHHFRFKVTEDVVTSLSVCYVGRGFDAIYACSEIQLYIYDSGRWSGIGGYASAGIDGSMVSIKKTLQSPAGCVDSGGMVHILAMGPNGRIFSFLDTDYIELTVKGSDYAWPSNLTLDLGADGFAEFEWPGQLQGKTVLSGEALGAPLQSFVDAVAEEGGSVEVPFRFFSDTGGVLSVRGQVDLDLPPVFSPIPPEKARFDEDTVACRLIDLDNFCQDDRDLRPRYEIIQQPPDGKIGCQLNASGHHLDFWPTAPNWSGTREFCLRATDRSGLSATTCFNVTVLPVNDPPVLLRVADQTAYEDQPFSLTLRASDVDDFASSLVFSDDFILSDVGPTTGVLLFTPTNDQVGRYPVTVSVQDPGGAVASMSFFITVENVNDPPVLVCDEELFAIEDERFEYRPEGLDIDRGDGLTYSLDSDIEGLEADPATGQIEFVFGNEHVGEHELELSVTDRANATDTRCLLLYVENVNDPPVLEQAVVLHAVEDEEFEHRLNATDVDPGDRLTYSIDCAFLALEEDTGIIRFTPGDGHVGRHRLNVKVTDAAGVSATARYTLVVENVNDPPSDVAIVSPRANAELREGEPVMLTATAFDPDIGDLLVFTWKEGERVLGRGANLSTTLPAGPHLLTLEVSDGTVNETVDVRFTVLGVETVPAGIQAIVNLAAIPLGLLLAAAVAVVLVTRRKRRGMLGGWQGHSSLASPPFQPPPQPAAPQPLPDGMQRPPYRPPGSQPGVPPVPAQPPAGLYSPPFYPPGQQPPPGPYQPAGFDRFPQPGFPGGTIAIQPAQPVIGPPSQAPLARTPAGHLQPPPGPTAAAPPGAEPPYAIPLSDGPSADSAGAPRHGPPPPERPPRPGGGPPAGNAEPGPERDRPRPGTGRRRRGDDSVVSREAMRAAINDARHAIGAARAAGLNPSDCDQLLSDAMAASYRQDYPRARNLARRSESMALSLLERASREDGPDRDAIDESDGEAPGEDAGEAA